MSSRPRSRSSARLVGPMCRNQRCIKYALMKYKFCEGCKTFLDHFRKRLGQMATKKSVAKLKRATRDFDEVNTHIVKLAVANWTKVVGDPRDVASHAIHLWLQDWWHRPCGESPQRQISLYREMRKLEKEFGLPEIKLGLRRFGFVLATNCTLTRVQLQNVWKRERMDGLHAVCRSNIQFAKSMINCVNMFFQRISLHDFVIRNDMFIQEMNVVGFNVGLTLHY